MRVTGPSAGPVILATSLLSALVLVSFRSNQQPVALLESQDSVDYTKGHNLGDKLSHQLRWDLAHALREDVASQLPAIRLKYGNMVAKGVASLLQTQSSPGKDPFSEDDLFKNDPDLVFPPGLEPDELDDEFGEQTVSACRLKPAFTLTQRWDAAGQTTGKEAISCAASKKDYEDR